MMLMLRRLILVSLAGVALAAIPFVAQAETGLVSPNNSASVLQPTASQSLQTGADQGSAASASFLNDELVGGQQSPQADNPATASFPWGDLAAAILLALGLAGLLIILYRSRPKTVTEPEPINQSQPAAKIKSKSKTKSKSKSKPRKK